MRLPTRAAGLAAVCGLALVPAPANGGPAFRAARDAAARAHSLDHLKQVALAMHDYHDIRMQFPVDVLDKTGKPLLSWRVLILPYIGQENVYKMFKLDEPWDSPANIKASRTVIPTFLSPNAPPPAGGPGAPGMTHYQGVAGPGTAFEPGNPITFTNLRTIPDGTSNTILLVEHGEAVPWAKPGDIPYDPKKPLPRFGIPGNDILLVALADATARTIDLKKTSEKTLRGALTPAGGEVLGNDW
ncbi:MAG: hypothetical protein C0501_03195 [Isosphaera sp.]|nr:hypothetical protein [Isosphaera sp.]